MHERIPAVIALAVIALIEGLALLGYAVFDVAELVRVGITGPEEVSNVPAVLLLIGVTAALGAGMVWVARGWWLVARWARSPFVLAQLIGGLIGYQLTQAVGSVERSVGFALFGLAVLGIVLAFTPPVLGALREDEDPDH